MEYTPHGFCISWDPLLLWSTILANFGIFIAYFGIPFYLLTGLNRLVSIPPGTIIRFAAFILFCGISHLLEIIAIWKPIYWLLAFELWITALVSLTTLFLLKRDFQWIENETLKELQDIVNKYD